MKCPSCGADNKTEAVNCSYCGSNLNSGSTSRVGVFEQIKISPAYANRDSAERHARLPKVHPMHTIFIFGFFAVFIGGSGLMAAMAIGMGLFSTSFGRGFGPAAGTIPFLFAVVPVGFAAFGVFMLMTIRKRMSAFGESPVEAIPVIVVDKRTEVSGSKTTRTSYFATCEDEQGERNEYQLWDGALYGRITADDAGILFVRSTFGMDFDRITT